MLIDRAGFAERGESFQEFFHQLHALPGCPAEVFGDFFGRGGGAEIGQGGSDGGGLF